MKRIGILTAGGDTPALNATIHGAVVRSNQLKIEIYGFIKGFNCFFNPRVPHVHLNPLFQSIPELDPTKGGTLIGSSRDYVDANNREECDLLTARMQKLGIEEFRRIVLEEVRTMPEDPSWRKYFDEIPKYEEKPAFQPVRLTRTPTAFSASARSTSSNSRFWRAGE